MKSFRKLKVTITHIETNEGVYGTEFNIKGGSNFTPEEVNTVINQAKKDWWEGIKAAQKDHGNALKDKPTLNIVK